MPSSKGYKRNYKQEYAQKGQSGTNGKKDRAARNRARDIAKKKGKNVKGKDLCHKKSLKTGGSRSVKNTKVCKRSANRSAGGSSGSRAGKAAGGRRGGKKR